MGFKIFEHAAALIGRTPWEVSRDAELLFQAQAAAYRLSRHQPLIAKKLWDRLDILVRVNLHSGLVARGSWDKLRAEADRVLAFACGRPNTVLGAGVLPYETKPEHVFRLRDYVAAARFQT